MSKRPNSMGFYEAWRAHVDAGFERSQTEADKLAKECGLEMAPPLSDLRDQDQETISAIVEVMKSPAGQQLLQRIADTFLPVVEK